MRAARGAVLATPVAALLVCAPHHLTRFAPLQLWVAWVGVLGGLLALRRADHNQRSRPLATDPLAPHALRLARWAWWGLMAWGALSLTWSPDPGRGLALWLLWLLTGIWWVLLARALAGDSARTRGSLPRQLAWTWLGGASLVAGLALVQRGGALRLGLHQVTATLGNPNVVAVILVLCLPLAVLLARGERRSGLRRLAWALAGLLVVGVVATGCRAALLALAVQVLFWALARRPGRRFRVAAGLLLVAAVGVAWSGGPLRRQASQAVAGRVFIARVTSRVMAPRPLQGTGLGGYGARAAWAQGSLLEQQPGLRARWSHLTDAHNQPLMVGAELGLVGLVGLLGLLGPLLWLLYRRRRSPWAHHGLAAWLGLGICGLSETVLLTPAVVLLAFGWLALGATRGGGPSEEPGVTTVARSWRSRMRVAVPVILAGLGVALATGELLGHVHLGRGLRHQGTAPDPARLRGAIARYDRGLQGLGARSSLLFQRGLARRALGDLVGASADMQRAFARQPSPARALFLGDVCLARGDVGGGIRWYRRALRLHPRYQRAHNNLGVALLRAGRRGEACGHLIRARSLLPGSRAARRNLRAHCGSARPRRIRRPGAQAAR